MTRASNRKNIPLLALTLAVVMLGFGVVIPVFPFYIQSMGASGDELGLLIAISPFMQLICAPLWGDVSDRIGRKPVLMAGILGYGLSMLFFGLATQLWMLYVIRGLGADPLRRNPADDQRLCRRQHERGGSQRRHGHPGRGHRPGHDARPGAGRLAGRGIAGDAVLHHRGVLPADAGLIAVLLPESLPATARKPPSDSWIRAQAVTAWPRRTG